MCRDCGCETANQKARLKIGQIDFSKKRVLTIEEAVLAKNDQLAEQNRVWFLQNQIRVFNLMSSPGSGKTFLLEKTIERLSSRAKVAILTGDQERDYDAKRLKACGATVKQLNTINSCHLDAAMISKELGGFVKPDLDILIIENIGNLVCPAAFDLGEEQKIALLSTTEGEDKPSKYPLLFSEAKLILLTKMDLVPYLDWDAELCIEHIRRINQSAPILKVSSKTGEGLDLWVDYLLTKKEALLPRPRPFSEHPLTQ